MYHTYLIKQQSQLSLWLSHPLTQAVCPFPHEESHLLPSLGTLVSQCPRYECLPAPGGAVEQNPPWGLNFEAVKDLGVEEGEENHLFEGADMFFQSTDGIKCNLGD